MVSKRSPSKEASLGLAVVALFIDLTQAARHRRTCPTCRNRDFWAVALDVGHLLQTL